MTTSTQIHTQVAPIAIMHGVPTNQLSPEQHLQATIARLTTAMQEADQSLSQLTESNDEMTALQAARTLSLLNICQSKFAQMMGVTV